MRVDGRKVVVGETADRLDALVETDARHFRETLGEQVDFGVFLGHGRGRVGLRGGRVGGGGGGGRAAEGRFLAFFLGRRVVGEIHVVVIREVGERREL